MRRAATWLAALLVCAAPAHALGSFKTETITLKNGLRLVLAPDAQAKSVDVAVWYDAGSREDAPGRTGVAHLFEHLMFRGSTHVAGDEHSRLVRNEGGTSGAYAAHDFTAFYETLPPDALELAFRLEADRMTGLVMTQQGLDAERQQMPDERERRATPITLGLERAYALAFPDHSYGVPVFGRESDLAAITLKDCRDFYQARFGPARAVVTVVGRFERDHALALAAKYFEPLKGGPTRASTLRAPKPQTVERRAVERTLVPLRVLMVAWPVPPRSHQDWAPLSLLSTLLTRSQDGPLQRRLTGNPPLCLSVQGDVDSRREASLFYLALAVAPSADSAEVERALFGELDRVAKQPVDAADLDRAKRQIETSVLFGLQTPRGRAQALGSSIALAGDTADLDHLLERIRAATPADLQRAAAQLGPSRRNVVWLVPGTGAEPGKTMGARR